MIVVATADFELYHELVGELRDRDATFTTIDPGEELPEGTRVAVVGHEDPDPRDPDGETEIDLVRATPDAPREAITEALTSGAGIRRTVGVDPGSRPGIAVLQGDEVIAVFQVPETEAAAVVAREIEGHPDAVVRIGDGARLRGSRIVDELDTRVELVDETGTTPHLGAGARGMGDVLAAVNIARREGEPISERPIEPTAGELQAIKDRARERSGNRTLPESLARKVAAGDLTLEEALGEHEGE